MTSLCAHPSAGSCEELERELEQLQVQFKASVQEEVDKALRKYQREQKELVQAQVDESARLAEEKETQRRIVQLTGLHEQAMRRLGHLATSRAFNCWNESCYERNRSRQLLQRAAARMTKPRLAGAFIEWWTVCDAALREEERQRMEVCRLYQPEKVEPELRLSHAHCQRSLASHTTTGGEAGAHPTDQGSTAARGADRAGDSRESRICQSALRCSPLLLARRLF